MHWLIVEETIEQRILEVCKEKDAIESDFFGERRGKMKSHLNVTTLGRLIGYGNKRKRQAEAEIGSILRPAPAARPNVLAAPSTGHTLDGKAAASDIIWERLRNATLLSAPVPTTPFQPLQPFQLSALMGHHLRVEPQLPRFDFTLPGAMSVPPQMQLHLDYMNDLARSRQALYKFMQS